MCELTTAMAIGSTVMGIAQAQAQARRDAGMARYNAAVARNQATAVRQRAAIEEARRRDLTRRTLGRDAARFLTGGVAVEGSPLEVLGDTAAQGELDALTVRYGAVLDSQGAENRARLEDWHAQQAVRRGQQAVGTALLSAAFGGGDPSPTKKTASPKKPMPMTMTMPKPLPRTGYTAGIPGGHGRLVGGV